MKKFIIPSLHHRSSRFKKKIPLFNAKRYIPSEWAYGEYGRPPKIPGKAVLVFKMEIVEIKGDKVPKEEGKEEL